MDLSEKGNLKIESGKDVPTVPIKTYKWEDIRRARRKGGYPWTYLYKEEFDECIDLENFKMDGVRKNKTSSASSASDSLDIREITEDDVKCLEGIDSSYVVIEGPILLGGQIEEPLKDQDVVIESAESSDNISQYLDKDDRDREMESTETLTLPGANISEHVETDDKTLQRARSEEPKRKRKLSIESNYSRISLSRLGVMKRLREAKEKIKLPKLGKSPKAEKKIISQEEMTKPKKEFLSHPKTNVKPVYIHIPLKPPEGQTDEFSYLEFEEKRPQADPIPEVSVEGPENDSTSDENEVQMTKSIEKEQTETQMESSENNLGLSVPSNDDDDLSAIIFLEGDEEGNNKGEYDIMVVDIDEKSHEMKMSQVTNTEVRRQMMESIKKVESKTDLAEGKGDSDGNLSRSSSRASKVSKSSIRKRRAKSAEPEKKRRSSIDSSYSRKSLSKIGLLRKLKEIHLPFTKSQSKKSVNNTTLDSKEETTTSTKIPKLQLKDQKPEYIYIPLKPPAGHTDEFSHLEYEAAPTERPVDENIESNEAKVEEASPPETPQVVPTPQFIVLTPPSDDELLDRPDIPETPSSETGSLFHFGELKQMAKKAIEQIHGPLECVNEETETKNDVKNTSAVEVEVDTKNNEIEEKVSIDEEDGLKLTRKSVEDTKTSLKSNLKGDSSPLPKKKVSFKRRKSSQISKDDGYEEIESPALSSDAVFADKSTENMEVQSDDNKQAVSTEEQKITMNSESSVEEDRRRWSKLSDHEYEPINPPPEDKPERSPPKSHVSELLNPSRHLSDSDMHLDLSVQEIQSEIENRYFNDSNSASNDKKDDSPTRKSPSKRSSRSQSREKEPTKPHKFQAAMRDSANRFKSKFQNIKRPKISLPPRPKFQKPNIKKPNIHLPKLPDLASTFRRSSKPEEKVITENEPVVVDDTNRKGIFDFSTYPRLFKKKRQEYYSGSLKTRKKVNQEDGEYSDTSGNKRKESNKSTAEVIRIPLHSEESMDQDNGVDPQPHDQPEEETSPSQFLQGIEDADDEDSRHNEGQERHRAAMAAASGPEESRWNNGIFYRTQNNTTGPHYDYDDEDENQNLNQLERNEITTDLDQPESEILQQSFIPNRQRGKLQQNDSIDTNHSRDVGSSVSSLGQHRTGVLEEIDSDQFFLREKGISQDNIDMGKYLSSEIREAFRMPTNALADMRAYNHEALRASNQSLPETKKKQIKKPRRKKTPHASEDELRYEPESENENYNFMPPTRPRRKSKRSKKAEYKTKMLPYTDTISVEPPAQEVVYSVDEVEGNSFPVYYENSHMVDKEQPNIHVTDQHKNRLHVHDTHDFHRRASEPIPAAPPRKHKSLKSLNASEHESIFDDYDRNENNNINGHVNGNTFVPTRMQSTPISDEHFQMSQEPVQPPKPPSRCRSKTRSMSRTTSHADADSIFGRTDSIMYDEDNRQPIVEEPCIKDLRDAMGYAIVDKNQNKNWEHKFCTVPRSHNKEPAKSPERPTRNYSTLGPTRPPRKLSKNMTDEEKENIDISQYIEIEDERDLQSGEVIQKMQNRPLPAPPRPPRARSKPLHDSSSDQNIMANKEDGSHNIQKHLDDTHLIDETEVSTQTEPLPADFVCEEVVQEETDKIMTPSALRKNGSSQEATETPTKVSIERILLTPTHYSYEEETITHGQLLVEPLNGAQILPDSELSREKNILITSDEESISEVPESFTKLSDSHQLKTVGNAAQPVKIPASPVPECIDVLKTQKLQVSDLDVDRLTVNELVANKIIVSDIDSGNITSHEICSKSGTIKLADIALEPDIMKKLLEQFKESSKQQKSLLEEVPEESQKDIKPEQKKTPIDFHVLETSTLTLTNTPSEEDFTVAITQEDEDILPQSIEECIIPVIDDQDTPSVSEAVALEEIITEEPMQFLELEINTSKSEKCETKSEVTAPTTNSTMHFGIDIDVVNGSIINSEELHSSHSELQNNCPPIKPPRSYGMKNNCDETKETEESPHISEATESEPGELERRRQLTENESVQPIDIIEPEIDDEPPPRPPVPQVAYIPSQPPVSFYALRAQHYVEGIPDDIPMVPRRKRHHRPAALSKSSSSESSELPVPRRRVRSPEPSIPQLTGQLIGACSVVTRNMIKRLIDDVNSNIACNTNAENENDKQNVQVVIVILLVLIAGLLLLGYGDGRTVHLHHWEFFNPPTDI